MSLRGWNNFLTLPVPPHKGRGSSIPRETFWEEEEQSVTKISREFRHLGAEEVDVTFFSFFLFSLFYKLSSPSLPISSFSFYCSFIGWSLSLSFFFFSFSLSVLLLFLFTLQLCVFRVILFWMYFYHDAKMKLRIWKHNDCRKGHHESHHKLHDNDYNN